MDFQKNFILVPGLERLQNRDLVCIKDDRPKIMHWGMTSKYMQLDLCDTALSKVCLSFMRSMY